MQQREKPLIAFGGKVPQPAKGKSGRSSTDGRSHRSVSGAASRRVVNTSEKKAAVETIKQEGELTRESAQHSIASTQCAARSQIIQEAAMPHGGDRMAVVQSSPSASPSPSPPRHLLAESMIPMAEPRMLNIDQMTGYPFIYSDMREIPYMAATTNSDISSPDQAERFNTTSNFGRPAAALLAGNLFPVDEGARDAEKPSFLAQEEEDMTQVTLTQHFASQRLTEDLRRPQMNTLEVAPSTIRGEAADD